MDFLKISRYCFSVMLCVTMYYLFSDRDCIFYTYFYIYIYFLVELLFKLSEDDGVKNSTPKKNVEASSDQRLQKVR